MSRNRVILTDFQKKGQEGKFFVSVMVFVHEGTDCELEKNEFELFGKNSVPYFEKQEIIEFVNNVKGIKNEDKTNFEKQLNEFYKEYHDRVVEYY